MRSARLAFMFAAAAGCGNAPLPVTSTPLHRADDVAIVTPAPAVDAAVDAAVEPDAPVDAGDPAARIACAGATLDLHEIIEHDACRVSENPTTLPKAIRVRIDPPLRARAGNPARSAIVLENTSGEKVELRLTATCGWVTTEVFDPRGRRAEYEGACGPGGGGCGTGSTIGIRLAPHGRASFPFEVATEVKNCTSENRPMKPGTYRVNLQATFLGTQLHAPLVVKSN